MISFGNKKMVCVVDTSFFLEKHTLVKRNNNYIEKRNKSFPEKSGLSKGGKVFPREVLKMS